MEDKYLYEENLNEEKINIDQIIINIQDHIKVKDKFEYDKEILEKKNFIITENSIERIQKISHYISRGIPVLLEGPTGTSKTFSTEFACLIAKPNNPLIRFNMSSDTVPSDLLGKMVGNKDSLAGLSLEYGHFLKAYKDGHPLLLDEINLASEAVLQCIEEALDSDSISIEIPGFPLKSIPKHKDFALIATQNPNKGLFANKRQNLGNKFKSKFQIITFPEFTEEELLQIANGLAKKFNYILNDDDNLETQKKNKILEDLVKFHKVWENMEEIKDDVKCFTVREIAASVKAFSKGMNIYDTIMTIYGARYTKELKEKLSNLLKNYESFKDIQPDKLTLPEKFPNCFQNTALLQAIKSIKFALENNRHIIISGKEETGKTQLALWMAEWYIEKNKIDKSNIFYCLCTEELKCPDLIGRQSPTNNTEPGEELIEWKNGFLSKAVENGGIVVLDALDQATITVTERLNGLLDQKYDDTEKAKFYIPENPKKPEILINPNFRLICTTDISNINHMSPSFVNRFDIIVLEDQLECLSEDEKKELIKFLLINSYNEEKIRILKEKLKKENEIEEEEDSDKIEQKNNEKKLYDITFNEEENISNDEEKNLNEENIEENKEVEILNEKNMGEIQFEEERDEENEEGNNSNEDNENIKNEEKEKNDDDENAKNIQNFIYGEEEEDKNIIKEENLEKEKQNEIIEDNNNEKENDEIDENDNNPYIIEEFDPSQDIIDFIYMKLKDFNTIFKLNKFCRTIRIFISKFKNEKEIAAKSIAEFCYDL